MAGEKLARAIKKGQTRPSDLTDVIYGTVVNDSPIKIRREDGVEVPSNFIELSQMAKGLKFRLDGKDIEIVKAIKKGDKVRMLQAQKSQVFYVLERV